jgi:hypothetical protein
VQTGPLRRPTIQAGTGLQRATVLASGLSCSTKVERSASSTDVAFEHDKWAIGIVQTDALSYQGRTRLFPHLPSHHRARLVGGFLVAWHRSTFLCQQSQFLATHLPRFINHVRRPPDKSKSAAKAPGPMAAGITAHLSMRLITSATTLSGQRFSWPAKRYDDHTFLTFDPTTLSRTVRDYFEFLSLVRSQTRKRLRTPHFC